MSNPAQDVQPALQAFIRRSREKGGWSGLITDEVLEETGLYWLGAMAQNHVSRSASAPFLNDVHAALQTCDWSQHGHLSQAAFRQQILGFAALCDQLQHSRDDDLQAGIAKARSRMTSGIATGMAKVAGVVALNASYQLVNEVNVLSRGPFKTRSEQIAILVEELAKLHQDAIPHVRAWGTEQRARPGASGSSSDGCLIMVASLAGFALATSWSLSKALGLI